MSPEIGSPGAVESLDQWRRVDGVKENRQWICAISERCRRQIVNDVWYTLVLARRTWIISVRPAPHRPATHTVSSGPEGVCAVALAPRAISPEMIRVCHM